ncbi:hypothetical protein CFC21_040614 [Triticum aestivum]|uniref:DUF1618 domain-containing protein n=2 Tax=Triticum aestivum TaxID=4565 RepID=A0A3B6FIS1_WHEAT|nr:uncharacterized protein LOC123069254 [Triticum aestivum]KAF7028745.1 hypothetical protein CFC21_040614 [Triticum aestivum]
MDLTGGEESSTHNMQISWPSLNPPAHGYIDDGGERPPFVLIEPYACFANLINGTTASTPIMFDTELEGCSIQVTFCAVHPPDVSYLCVHAVGLGDPLFTNPPRILATETDGSLLLLCVPIPIPGHPFPLGAYVNSTREEYFVYNPRVPVLEHLRHPEPGSIPCLVDGTVAIVRKCSQHQHTSNPGRKQQPHRAGVHNLALHPHGAGVHNFALQSHGAGGHKFGLQPHGAGRHDCSNCSYVIAAQSERFGSDYPCQLYLYHSNTSSWTTPSVVFETPLDNEYQTHKTIFIGGEKGTLAWVDLSGTIVLWDVLGKGRRKFRQFQLPGPIDKGSDASTRDIAVLGSSINYVVMEYFARGWKATVWSISTNSLPGEGWGIRYHLDSSNLQGLEGEPATAPYIGLPKLSLQDDGTVFFLKQVDYRDPHQPAWVLAVDMRNKTVQKVAKFIPSGLYVDYETSRISKYLKVAPGTKQITKRPGTPLLKSPSKKHTGDTDDPMTAIDVC